LNHFDLAVRESKQSQSTVIFTSHYNVPSIGRPVKGA
jgi:hypothetical protein